jgi:hypothetical protein
MSHPFRHRFDGHRAAKGSYYCIGCRQTRTAKKDACNSAACDVSYFQSRLELGRAAELALLMAAGKISALRVHPRYTMKVRESEVGPYVADFQYVLDGKTVIEEVKPPNWEKRDRLAAFKIKVFRALLPQGQTFIIHQP